MTCKSPYSCTKVARSKGLCNACYMRQYKNNGVITPPRINQPKTCMAQNCNRKSNSKGLCGTHLWRMKKYGSCEIPAPTLHERICKVEDCGRKHKGLGLCERHLGRFKAYGDPLLGGPFRKSRNGVKCSVDGCNSRVCSNVTGYCNKHDRRFLKYGDPSVVKRHCFRRPKAVRHEPTPWRKDSRGYVWHYDPENPNASSGGLVYQHRHVMSQFLGRSLRDGENVHHKNGNREDNRLENLELWLVGQPSGQRIEDQVAWARKILEEYGDLVDRMQLFQNRHLRAIQP